MRVVDKTIGIDTSRVVEIASEIIQINNRYQNDFSVVEQAINRLKNDWQQPQKVSSAAFACFDEIKSKYFDSAIGERQELARYLCDIVGIGYEEVENTNKKLLEGLFDAGGVATSTAISVNNIGTSTVHSENYTSVDVEKYSELASNAEDARLCSRVNKLFDKENPTKNDFLAAIQSDDYFSDKDPIKHIKEDQIKVIDYGSGFGAVVIEDGESAMVIFAATNIGADNFWDKIADLGTDVSLALLPKNIQEKQALDLVNDLSEKYNNIVVTGHSLGGYLATSVALKNEAVSKCITFDPPGRNYYDTVACDGEFDSDRTSVITSYEADGSVISSVGYEVGNVQKIEVNGKGELLGKHNIDYICESLGGKEAIHNSWNNTNSAQTDDSGGGRF